MSLLRHIEIWSDLECNSGTHQANIPKHETLSAQINENLKGTDELVISMDRNGTAWSSISNRRILRVVFEDDSIREYRIVKPTDGRSNKGGTSAIVKAQSILLDLMNGIVNREENDGTITFFYTLLALSRSDLVDLMIADAPSYFDAGTISDSSTAVDTFTFNFENPLKALQELAAMEKLELAIRRNGSTSYYVDLVTAVGSDEDEFEIRYRKNLKGITREQDASKLANRIYPAGGEEGGAIRLGIAKARWSVATVVDANNITLDGDPISENDQLNGQYIERPNGTWVEIIDTIESTQQIQVNSHGLNVDDLIFFREDAAGLDLSYVESPSSQATHGVVVGVVEENDIPPVDNVVANPALNDWSGGLPVGWTEEGSPTTTEETGVDYTRVGGSSAKIVAADGEGIKCATITIAPVSPSIFYSFWSQVWVESGEIEMYAEHSTEGRYPPAGDEDQATTSELNKFIELIVETGEWPAGTVEIYILARNGVATFYVDAAQLTNTAQNLPFFVGNAANKLWLRGLDDLAERATVRTSYAIKVFDLNSALPDIFPYDAAVLGGTVLVEDEELTIQVQARLVSIKRNLKDPSKMLVELSNKRVTLIDALTQTTRRIRQTIPTRASIATITEFEASHTDDGSIVLKVLGGKGARSFRYIVDLTTMPTFAEVADTSNSDGATVNTVDGSDVVITIIRDHSGTTLGRNQRVYVRVVVFPILSAGGVAGATATGSTGPPSFWNATINDSPTPVQDGDATSDDATVTRSFEVDTRTVGVRIYRRKDAWPTKNGTQTGPLDPSYDRGVIGERDDWKYADGGWGGGDSVRDIAIALDANGLEGEREEYSYTVQNTAASDPRILDAYRVQDQEGTSCIDERQVTIYWTLADCDDPTHDLEVFRVVDEGPELQIQDEASPVTNTDFQDTNCPMYGGGSEARSCDYIIRLMEGATVLDTIRLNETHTGKEWNLCVTPE